MNEQNFVKRVSYLATGDGYRKCVPLDVLANVKDATGLVLDTSTTTPTIEALETNAYGLNAAASTTHVGLINWTVPDDYDASADELRIRLACNMAGNTNSAITITPKIYRKRPVPTTQDSLITVAAAALSADLGAPASAAINTLAEGTAWLEIVADAKVLATGAANRTLAATADASIQPGDVLTIVLTAAAHTTDAILVYGAELWYRSNLAFSNIAAR